MKIKVAVLLLAIGLLGLTGCNKDSQTLDQDNVKENTTMIKSDGTMLSFIVEDFEKDYYDKDELKSYIEENVQNYTKKAGADAVALDSLDVSSQMAIAKFTFKTVTDYAAFNEITCEILTKDEALADERISDTVYSIDKSETVDLKTALEKGNYKVLLMDMADENIKVEGKIAYYTNGTLVDKDTIKTGSEGVTVVIYE